MNHHTTEDRVLKKAKEEMEWFTKMFLINLSDFAERNDYEFEWCVDAFRSEFAKQLKRKEGETNDNV